MRSDAHVHVGRCLARAGGRAALDPRPPSARPPTTSSPAPRTSTLLLRCATTHSFLLLLSCRTPLVLLLALGTLLTRGSCRRRADHVASHRRPRLHHRLCRPRLPATFAHPVSAADGAEGRPAASPACRHPRVAPQCTACRPPLHNVGAADMLFAFVAEVAES